MTTPEPSGGIPRTRVWSMFDRIAPRYDALNSSLSCGVDRIWRRAVVRKIPTASSQIVADIASGTGDQLFTLCRLPQVTHVIGIDMSSGMLELGEKKRRARNPQATARFARGDALRLPLRDQSVTATTISFGIRNVEDVVAGLREMHRVLKPGGRSIILEFSLPRRPLRGLYLFYLRHILPRIGALLSGDGSAYRYLNQTVETFPYGDAFCDLMREAGFDTVTATRLSLGIATIYCGDKRDTA